jgi:hypothetical protein
VGLAHRQRQGAQVVAVERQNVEGIELHLIIVLAQVQRVEIEMPSTPRITASPSMTNCLYLFFSAASTIQLLKFFHLRC